MRIAVMLRAHDRPGGIGIYSRNIVKHLLELDGENEYILLYDKPDHLGTYADRPNVQELFVPRTNPILWDQWRVPRTLRGRGADLVFHTKFTIPLFTRAKRVMVLHGASWFVHPELYTKLDLFYVRRSMPIYCRRADYLISNSNLTTRDFIEIAGVPPDKIETVHLAAGDGFRPASSESDTQSIREKYGLPKRFVVTVTSFDPRKNFKTLIRAFELARAECDVDLVVVGKDCNRYARDHDLAGRGLAESVHFPGWIDQADLPGIYHAAEAFVFPSVYEEFGIPVVEAMACGCPVVSSNTGAIPELADDCALLAAPFDAEAMAANLVRLLAEPSLAKKLRDKGIERAKRFSWSEAARQTLEIFRKVHGLPARGVAR